MRVDPLGLCDQQKCTAARALLASLGQKMSSLGNSTALTGVGLIVADGVAEFFVPEGAELEIPLDEAGAGMVEFGGHVSTLGSTISGYASGGALGALKEGGSALILDQLASLTASKAFGGFTEAQKTAASSLIGQSADELRAEEAACNGN